MRRQAVLLAATTVIVLGGVYLLREATMSTHYDTGPDSRLDVVVRASSNRAEPGVTLLQAAAAQIDSCALEVSARREGDLRVLDGGSGHLGVTLAPALDSTDRKQYRGCLEDWSVDHLLVRVVSMTDREEAS
jgi:hypothetical protein